MHQISINLTRLLAMAVVAAAALLIGVTAMAPSADAAAPTQGVWRGDTLPELQLSPTTAAVWKPKMTITAYQGRILSVATTVRMECKSTFTIQDIRVNKSWRTGSGPKIRKTDGHYAFTANGVYFHGLLGRSSALGGASISRGADCHGQSRYTLPRGKY